MRNQGRRRTRNAPRSLWDTLVNPPWGGGCCAGREYINCVVRQGLIINTPLTHRHSYSLGCLFHLAMPSSRSEKKRPSASKSAKTADASPKLPRTAWKTREQLEYLLSCWDRFLTYQNEGTLDRFWPHVYAGWNKAWPIVPSPESINEYGSYENAVLTLRSENNNVRITWFYASNVELMIIHISR